MLLPGGPKKKPPALKPERTSAYAKEFGATSHSTPALYVVEVHVLDSSRARLNTTFGPTAGGWSGSTTSGPKVFLRVYRKLFVSFLSVVYRAPPTRRSVSVRLKVSCAKGA